MQINLKLLNRVLAQPWAIQREQLALFTQLVISPELSEAKFASGDPMLFKTTSCGPTEGRTVKAAGGGTMRRVTTPWGTPRMISCPPNVTPLNWEAACACDADQLPPIAPNITCILVWGAVGRAWSAYDRYWLDPVDYDQLVEAISAAPEGNQVVLWFRSPGGLAAGAPETAAAIRTLGRKREIRSWTDDLCASGAMWLASQTTRIDATPTASLGSIGVYLAFYDWTEYLAKLGVSLELFKAGSMKAMGLPGNPLSDEEAAYLQSGVDATYKQFTADVRKMRAVPDEACQGQCFEGQAAMDAVLVDGFAPSSAAYFAALSKGKI